MRNRHTLPILAAIALVGCGKQECGDRTHDEGGVCVADGPDVISHTNTITNEVPVDHTNTITNTNTIVETHTNTITHTNTNTITITETVTVTDGELDPGQFEENLVEIQELVGRGGALGSNGSGETHMHISEMKWRPTDGLTWPNTLAYCSYTFGVIDGSNLNSMSFLAQGYKVLPRTGTRDAGCMHLAFDETDTDIVFTTHHGNIDDGVSHLTGFNLNSNLTTAGNPTAVPPVLPRVSLLTGTTPTPVQLPMYTEPGVVFEGLDYENGLIYASIHQDGLGVYQYDPIGNAFSKLGSLPLEDSRDVEVIGNFAYVSDGPGGFAVLDVTDPANILEVGRLPLPGVAVDIVRGDDGVFYLATQSGGFVSVDASDPANPVLLQTIDIGQSVVAVDHDSGRLYIAAWVDTRVYDVTDPTDMKIIGAVRETKQKNYSSDGGDGGERPDITNRVLGVAGQGDYVFSGTWWVPHNYLLHPEEVAPYIVLPESVNYTAFEGDLDVGESSTTEIVIRNDGSAPLTVYDLWTTNSAFTVSPEQLYIEPGSSGTATVTFTATIGAGTTLVGTVIEQTGEEEGFLQIWSDDPGQPIREAYLVGNPEGVAIGDPYTNDATLLDGTPWSFTDDFLGSVTLVAYFATF